MDLAYMARMTPRNGILPDTSSVHVRWLSAISKKVIVVAQAVDDLLGEVAKQLSWKERHGLFEAI